ncbi:hypothetical protein NVIRPANT_00991 [Pantoea sp. Nvir]|nr:hypothetical protein NVIRPANT_00991 [Pantoea sp. Nvir]
MCFLVVHSAISSLCLALDCNDKKDIAMFKKNIVAIFSILLFSSLLSACNTTRGLGEDVEAGGQAIQRTTQ